MLSVQNLRCGDGSGPEAFWVLINGCRRSRKVTHILPYEVLPLPATWSDGMHVETLTCADQGFCLTSE